MSLDPSGSCLRPSACFLRASAATLFIVVTACTKPAEKKTADQEFPVDTTAAWFKVAKSWAERPGDRWSNDSLRRVLVEMGKEDQAVREKLKGDALKDTALLKQMNRADSASTAKLQAIVDRFGWPTKSMVGVQGANAAYLVAQHTPDTAFRAAVLEKMLAAPAGEVSPSDLATLQDRVLVRRGQLQRYGTQFSFDRDTMRMDPVEDPSHLDERRAIQGLMPIEEYRRILEQMYTLPATLEPKRK
jgi:hypothetical protein